MEKQIELEQIKQKKDGSIAKDSLILTVSKVISSLIGLVVTMLLSRYRSLYEYGTYVQLLLVINLLDNAIMLGLPNSISFFLGRAETEEKRKKFLSVYFTLNTILTLVSGLILVTLIYPIQIYFKNDGIHGFWYFLLLYPFAYVTSSSIENICVSTKRTGLLIPYRITHSVVIFTLVLVASLTHLDFSVYLLIFVLTEVIFAVSVILISRKIVGGIHVSLDKKLIKAILKFSIPLGIATAVATLNAEIDKFVIGFFGSTEDVAIYANCAKDLPLTILTAGITASILPRLSLLFKNGKGKEAVGIWSNAVLVSISIVSVFAIGLLFFSKDAISLLYSDKYLPGDNIFKVFCLVIVLKAVYWGTILNCSGHTKFIFYSSIISLSCNLVLNVPFYFLFGIFGCAVSTLLTTLVMNIVQLCWTCRITKVKFYEILPWSKIGLVLLFNITLGVFFSRVADLIPLEQYIGSILESIFLGAIWMVLYLAVVFPTLLRKIKSRG